MVRGRTREFDLDEAVDAALPVFWARGYDGATLAELTDAMGLRRGSLYAAFGSKEALFGRVLERYGQTVGGYIGRALQEPTAAAVIEGVLRGCVEATTGPDHPHGCLIVHGALSTTSESEPVRSELAAIRRADEAALRARLEELTHDHDGHEEPDRPELAVLAGLVTALVNGLSVKARSGATRAELHAIVDRSLQAGLLKSAADPGRP